MKRDEGFLSFSVRNQRKWSHSPSFYPVSLSWLGKKPSEPQKAQVPFGSSFGRRVDFAHKAEPAQGEGKKDARALRKLRAPPDDRERGAVCVGSHETTQAKEAADTSAASKAADSRGAMEPTRHASAPVVGEPPKAAVVERTQQDDDVKKNAQQAAGVSAADAVAEAAAAASGPFMKQQHQQQMYQSHLKQGVMQHLQCDLVCERCKQNKGEIMDLESNTVLCRVCSSSRASASRRCAPQSKPEAQVAAANKKGPSPNDGAPTSAAAAKKDEVSPVMGSKGNQLMSTISYSNAKYGGGPPMHVHVFGQPLGNFGAGGQGGYLNLPEAFMRGHSPGISFAFPEIADLRAREANKGMHQKSLLPPVTQFADGCKAVRHMDGTYEWIGGGDRIHASSDRSSDTAATTSEVGQASEAAKGFGSSGHGGNAHAMASLNASIRRKNALERYKSKKMSRKFTKKIRYESRKERADKRVRIRGRFAKVNT